MAKSTVGRINVLLTANTEPFIKGLKKANKGLGRFIVGLGKTALKLTSIAGALVAAAGTIGLGAFIKRSLESISAITAVADKLNITTEEAARLQHVVKSTGAAVGSFSQGMEQFEKNLGKANLEAGDQRDAIDALGLSHKKLAEVGAAERFKLVADAISKLPNRALQAKAALDLFGASGADLLPTLMKGRDELKAMGDEFAKTGNVHTREATAMVGMATAAFTKLKDIMAGVGQQIAIQLAPFLTAAARKLGEMATSGEGVGHKVSKAFEAIGLWIARLADWMELPKAAFFTFQAIGLRVIAALSKNFLRLAKIMADVLDTPINRKLLGVVGVDTKSLKAQIARMEAMRKGIENAGKKAWDNATGAIDNFVLKKNQESVKKWARGLVGGMKNEAVGIAAAARSAPGGLAELPGKEDKPNKPKDPLKEAKPKDPLKEAKTNGPGSFRQIVRSRAAAFGGSQAERQAQTMIEILRAINENLTKGPPAVAA